MLRSKIEQELKNSFMNLLNVESDMSIKNYISEQYEICLKLVSYLNIPEYFLECELLHKKNKEIKFLSSIDSTFIEKCDDFILQSIDILSSISEKEHLSYAIYLKIREDFFTMCSIISRVEICYNAVYNKLNIVKLRLRIETAQDVLNKIKKEHLENTSNKTLFRIQETEIYFNYVFEIFKTISDENYDTSLDYAEKYEELIDQFTNSLAVILQRNILDVKCVEHYTIMKTSIYIMRLLDYMNY